MTVRLLLVALTSLALAACNGDSAGTSSVSEGEAAALDKAAKMLDEKRLPEGALPETDAPASTPAETDASSTE